MIRQDAPELLRRATRAHLAERPAVALHAATITHRLRREHACDERDVVAALLFLQDLGQVAAIPDELGSEKYWRATAAGILAHEREG